MSRPFACFLVAVLALAGCDTDGVTPPPPVATDDPTPLIDFAEGETYKGFAGGLYPGGNTPPAAHEAFGLDAAGAIQPRDTSGAPDPEGKIVLLSVGMSNATQEWCRHTSQDRPGDTSCNAWTFTGQALADPDVNHSTLVIANGARASQDLVLWDHPSDANYDHVRDEVLAAHGATEAQVQAVWVKVALKDEPTRPSLPDPDADAFVEEAAIGNVVRALAARYPNLQQVFFSSRIYGGYAAPDSNTPEPWAYETGFATKWAIEAQIDQRATGLIDAEAGDLGEAPFMGWGAYLWASGTVPRSDGLIWPRDHFNEDGLHPSILGEERVGTLLLEFFKTSPFTACWFLQGMSC